MKLPLVSMLKEPNSKAHPYPCQIAMQTRRFIQGSVFHSALADFGAGQFFRTPDAYTKAKTDFVNSGMSNDTWEISWECFEEYTKVFPNPVYQGALFSMNVHWDWFIRRIGKFVEFGRKHTTSPLLGGKAQKKLSRIGFEKVAEQLKLLEDATDLNFNFPLAITAAIEEMILVRNIGVHNEWVVDQYYKEQTKSKGWSVGEIRMFTISELMDWQKGLLQIIEDISTPIAIKYVAAPDFKP